MSSALVENFVKIENRAKLCITIIHTCLLMNTLMPPRSKIKESSSCKISSAFLFHFRTYSRYHSRLTISRLSIHYTTTPYLCPLYSVAQQQQVSKQSKNKKNGQINKSVNLILLLNLLFLPLYGSGLGVRCRCRICGSGSGLGFLNLVGETRDVQWASSITGNEKKRVISFFKIQCRFLWLKFKNII